MARSYWPKRPPLVQLDPRENQGQVLDLCAGDSQLEDPCGEIGHCPLNTIVLTMMRNSDETRSSLGKLLDGMEEANPSFRPEHEVPAGLSEPPLPEKVGQCYPGGALVDDGETAWQFEEKKCKNRFHTEQKERIRMPVVPRVLSAEKIFEHEHSHIPFRNWCPFCVRRKSNADTQRNMVDENEVRRSVPSIEGREKSFDDSACGTWTKMLLAIPLERKSHATCERAQKTRDFGIPRLCRFCGRQ